MSDNFTAPLSKLPPFSHFLDGSNKWVVTPDQPDPLTVRATSVNLAGLPQIGAFDPEKEVEVIRLGSLQPMKKKRRAARKPSASRRLKTGIQLAFDLF